jgi:hypothetical protein
MNYFELNLVPRLILASLVLVAATLLHLSALWLYPDGEGWLGYLWYAWAPPFYDIAFAIMVLVPFISARRRRWIGVIALLFVAGIVYFALVYAVVNTQYALETWTDSSHLRFVTIVPLAVIATWLLAGATAWIGPLHVSWRYWIFTGLAGLITGLTALGLDIAGIDSGWFGNYGPYWLWPVVTCVSIYYGRQQ